MAPSVPYQSSNAAAQDAFDAKLNQTIFIIAFVVGGLSQLAAASYLCFWLIRKYRNRKALDTPQEKQLPKQLLLSSRAELSANTPKRLILSPLSVSRLGRMKHASTDGMAATGTRSCELASNSSVCTPAISPDDPCEKQLIVEVTTQTIQEGFASVPPSLPPLEMDLGTSDSDSLTLSSISTIVEVIEPVGFAPRIVVEDFAFTTRSFYPTINDSDSDSAMSVDDEKLDPHFLVVPPMSWMAPRDLVESKDATQQRTEPSANKIKKSISMSSMLSLLSDISNVARLRPRLPTSTSMPFVSKAIPGRSTPKTLVLTSGRWKENALTKAH